MIKEYERFLREYRRDARPLLESTTQQLALFMLERSERTKVTMLITLNDTVGTMPMGQRSGSDVRVNESGSTCPATRPRKSPLEKSRSIDAFAAALARGHSIESAGRTVGLSAATSYRWARDPDVADSACWYRSDTRREVVDTPATG